MTDPTHTGSEEPSGQPSHPRGRHLQLVPSEGLAGPAGLDAAQREQLAALEAQLVAASEQRAREVFEPRPAEVAPLNALEQVLPAQPFEAWADEGAAALTYPAAQSLAHFARSAAQRRKPAEARRVHTAPDVGAAGLSAGR